MTNEENIGRNLVDFLKQTHCFGKARDGYFPVEVTYTLIDQDENKKPIVRFVLSQTASGISFDNQELKARIGEGYIYDYSLSSSNGLIHFLKSMNRLFAICGIDMKFTQENSSGETIYEIIEKEKVLVGERFYVKFVDNQLVKFLSKEEEKELGLPSIEQTSK